MPEDQTDPTILSRRALLAAASATPLVCTAAEAAAPAADTLLGRCAQWLRSDFESDRLALRWSALETDAIAAYDYFKMDDSERLALPMGPEMAAIEGKLDELFDERESHFRAIAKIKPQNVHEAASLLAIAARIEVHDPSPAAPMVRRAMDFIGASKCPGCGAPYVPASLPKS